MERPDVDRVAAIISRYFPVAEQAEELDDMEFMLNWNRLQGGNYRALHERWQPIFDLVRELRESVTAARADAIGQVQTAVDKFFNGLLAMHVNKCELDVVLQDLNASTAPIVSDEP